MTDLSPKLTAPERVSEPALNLLHCCHRGDQAVAGLAATVKAAGASHILLKPYQPNHIQGLPQQQVVHVKRCIRACLLNASKHLVRGCQDVLKALPAEHCMHSGNDCMVMRLQYVPLSLHRFLGW